MTKEVTSLPGRKLFRRPVMTPASARSITPSDIIYVNAGVVAPPLSWLNALKPGGRLIFPWRPRHDIGLAVLARKEDAGFAVQVLSGAWFIPCSGASDEGITIRRPSPREARRARAIFLRSQREPDSSAIAVYPHLWFSARPLGE